MTTVHANSHCIILSLVAAQACVSMAHIYLFKPNGFSYHRKLDELISTISTIRVTVGNFVFLFNCTPAGRTSDSMTVPTLRLIYR